MTQITPQQQFEDLLKDRIREDIGKLMPDEALAAIIEKAVEGFFFRGRVTGQGSWNERIEPSWIEKLVGSLVEARMRGVVDAFMATNANRLDEIIEAGLREHAPAFVAKAVMGSLDHRMFGLQQSMQALLAQPR